MGIKDFCSQMDLKTGCLIIGYLGMILETMNAVLGYEYAEEIIKRQGATEDVQSIATSLTRFIIIVSWAFSMLINILMIVGVYKDRLGLIFAYIIINTICVPIGVLGMAYTMFKGTGNAFTCVKNLILMAFYMFGIAVTRIYYYSKRQGHVIEGPVNYSESESE
ncbi:uncharacterized protein LOC142977185 [Anticarsia gemmatalis]|uniref:uncharacterized protein LOC142977185 n=1 Tax=Anticarsia gemmatalis TaxID=129554 RepID=UPI003F77154C